VGGGYSKLERKAGDYATAGVAVVVRLDDGGAFAGVGIGVTGVSPSPFAAPTAESLAIGAQPDEALYRAVGDAAAAQSEPTADVRGPVDYKRAMVSEMTVRSFRTAVERARSFA
jgi:carbon-monoxide dehydrogenase medium subunit